MCADHVFNLKLKTELIPDPDSVSCVHIYRVYQICICIDSIMRAYVYSVTCLYMYRVYMYIVYHVCICLECIKPLCVHTVCI